MKIKKAKVFDVELFDYSGHVFNLEVESLEDCSTKDDLFWVDFGSKLVTHNCFPKDLNALKFIANENGVKTNVLDAVWRKNLEVRQNRDWEKMKGRAVSDESENECKVQIFKDKERWNKENKFEIGDVVVLWNWKDNTYDFGKIKKGPFKTMFTEMGMEGNFVEIDSYTVETKFAGIYDVECLAIYGRYANDKE